MSSSLYMVLSYFPSTEKAAEVVQKLLEKKLIACANIAPTVTSHYVWEDKICMEQETPVWIKTTQAQLSEVENMIKSLHTYKVPAILKWAIEANADYAHWANASLGPLIFNVKE